jgi:predicted adenine nucleotide alpha hydrolase (AANH) superfamily ATPase
MEKDMKLLLHICCGPCSTYPVQELLKEGFEIQGLFYNPNIHPIEEHKRRKENVEKMSSITNIPVVYNDDFRQSEWENLEDKGAARCTGCYSLRMEEAARYASENGFEAFTTTLLVSPYQKHELIKELGEFYAEKYRVAFAYRDFRPGFRQGQQMAKEMGLYRQKYCGCILSVNG